MVYSTRRFVLCHVLCYFVLVFFSPFSIAITSLGEERAASLGAFHMFVGFLLVWFCLFPLALGVWEGLRFVIVALPRLFSYPFFCQRVCKNGKRNIQGATITNCSPSKTPRGSGDKTKQAQIKQMYEKH